MKHFSFYTGKAGHALLEYLQKICLISFMIAIPFALQANVLVTSKSDKTALFSSKNYSEILWNATGIKKRSVSSSSAAVGGDFSLDFSASAPLQYNHTIGGGAWQDGTIGRNDDVVESLEGGDFTCGDIVTFFTKIDVASGAISSQSIEIDYSFLAHSTGQPGVALYLPVGVYLTNDPTAPGYEADAGYTGDGDETISISDAFHLEGCQGPGCTPTLFEKPAETIGSVTVGGLEAGESVIVRIDVKIHCKPGSSPTGNLQAAITDGRAVGFTGREANITVGNQTIPFKNVNLIVFPTCNITPKDPVCEGATTRYTASSDVADATFKWSITGDGSINGAAVDGTKTVVATGGATSTSVDVLAKTSGMYTLSVEISKSGFGTQNCSEIITINPGATAEAGLSGSVCQGRQTIDLTRGDPSVGGGATTGTWSIVSPSSADVVLTNNTLAGGTLGIAGTFTGEITLMLTSNDPDGPCEAATDTRTIMVNGSPNADAGPDKKLTCTATSVMLSGSSSTEGVTYMWVASNGGNIVSGEDTATPTVNAAGTYTLTVTKTSTKCQNTDVVMVTQDASLPNVNAGSDKMLTCTTTSVMLNGSSTTAGVTFAWTTSDGNIVSDHNKATPTVNAAGTYTLTVTNPANGCKAMASVRVTLATDRPNISAQGGTLSCDTHSVQLMGSSDTPGVTYHWSGPGGYMSNDQNPTVMVAGEYTLTVRKTATGCESSRTVTVRPQPVTPRPEVTCYTIDFEHDRGMISHTMTDAGMVHVFGKKQNADGTHEPDNYAGIFDSQAPTGDDDDLYTTNWGNVLIINQDKSGVPNDNQWGGELWLDFSAFGPVTMTSLKALDFDEYEDYSWVILYGADDRELYRVQILPLGDNSKQVVDLGNTKGVMKMQVLMAGTGLEYVGSGAIDDIKFCVEKEGQEECYQPRQEASASAYPTPFTDKATIEFSAAETGKYVVNLYNLNGKLVKELKRGTARKGDLTNVDVNSHNLPNGMYIAHIISGNSTKYVKLILKR